MKKTLGKEKALKCVCCGAGLKGVTNDSVNVKCEYCGQIVNVNEEDNSFNAQAILERISQLGNRVRKDSFNADYDRLRHLIRNHSYDDATLLLNDILKDDITQARAWYYKSLLPVMDKSEVKFRGCIVDIHHVAKLTQRNEINDYLESCNLSLPARRAFLHHYATGGFLHEQQSQFINEAIQYASTPRRREFFKLKRQEYNTRWKKKVAKRSLMRFFFVTAFIISAAIVIFVGIYAFATVLRVLLVQ